MTPPDSILKRIAPWVVLAIGLIAVGVVVVYMVGSWLIIDALSEGPFEVGVRTWRDDNRNGIRDDSEPAIAFVNVTLDDVTNSDPLARGVTDENGVLVFGGLLQPKRSDVYEVYAEAPPGYAVAGPERVRVNFGTAEKTPIDLGLSLLPGQPTPTPRPAVALDCQVIYEASSENDYASVVAIQTEPEGSVFLSLSNPSGLRRYAADGTFLESLPAVSLVPSAYSAVFPRILVGPDGRIWGWSSQVADGLAVFDGEAWHAVAPYDHPGDHQVYNAAIAADGAIWLGTDLGALRLDEATGQWTRHASYRPIVAVVPTPDGTVWLLECKGMSPCVQTLIRLTPGGPWLYEESDVTTLERAFNNVHGASYDELAIWVVDDFGLDRWDIAAATWTHYTPATTDNAFPPATYISAYDMAPDGAFWLATPEQGFVEDRLQFRERRFAFIRARPQSGEWYFASNPLMDGQYIDSVAVAGDGSVWANLRYQYAVYRCE